ncbi:hypothetical protein G8764_06090 [Pseudomaricurvus alcaniphilus]|uniref:C-glycoside deglycosidase beta subunit domain-containing protein n=1 Tax=Pseudomaricurvus alcaniphilus TaxID=1166482 RepID=UPI0014078702|nr:DUF6379 domain-containing protein [Pseudomaricurvus alcaniphilus]NHN36862.1 hypothetical protein [Pseudomaricurvus alcaniphilus]
MMHHRVIADNGLKVTSGGCAVAVRLPWYRSLPLSVVDVVSIEFDGRVIDMSNVVFQLEGSSIRLDELRARTTENWFVLDTAYLVLNEKNLEVGKEYDVAVTLAIYPPYLKDLHRVVRTQKRLLAH